LILRYNQFSYGNAGEQKFGPDTVYGFLQNVMQMEVFRKGFNALTDQLVFVAIASLILSV